MTYPGQRRHSCGLDLCRGKTRREQFIKVGSDTRRRAAIPQLRYAAALAARRDDLVDTCENTRAVSTDDGVRALVDGDRSFGVFAHGETRDRQRRCLFLDAA